MLSLVMQAARQLAEEDLSAEAEPHLSSFFSQTTPYDQQQMVEQRNLNCELRPELTQLVQLLHNEKMSPDLLPYQEALVHTVSKAITSQERRLQSNQSTDPDDRFYANSLKMEVERAKFVLKSYLRQRIAKIEKYLLWVVEKDQSALLSNAEMAFAFSLYESRKTHLQENLFDKIPKKLNFMAQDTLPDQYSKCAHCLFVQSRFRTPTRWFSRECSPTSRTASQ